MTKLKICLFVVFFAVVKVSAQENIPEGFSVKQQLIVQFDDDAKRDTVRLISDGSHFEYRLLIALSSMGTTRSIAIGHSYDSENFPIYPGKLSFSNKVLQYGFGTPGTAHYYYQFKLRFNSEVDKIQVIGFDFDYNSGSAGSAHTTLSFNLLTGDFVRTEIFRGSLADKKTRRRDGNNKYFQQLFVEELTTEVIQQLTRAASEDQVGINQLLDSIRAHSFLYGSKRANYGTMETWNQKLTTGLIRYGQQHPRFLEQNDPFSRNNQLTVLTSADKEFRIICWNDGMSGTMQEWRAIAFWKASSEIHSRSLYSDTTQQGVYGLAPEYWNIKTYELADGQTVYYVRGIGHGSNRLKISFVKAFAISSSGELNDQVQFFKTPSKTLNHISLRIDLMTAPRDDYNPYIHLSKNRQTLYIPVADKKGKLSVDKQLVYQFNERYFVFQGVE